MKQEQHAPSMEVSMFVAPCQLFSILKQGDDQYRQYDDMQNNKAWFRSVAKSITLWKRTSNLNDSECIVVDTNMCKRLVYNEEL